jgi:hypothetical protein
MKPPEVEENPYQSPMADLQAVGVLSGKQEDLRAVALYQKGILVCILIYMIAIIGYFLIPVDVRNLIALGVAVVALVALVFVFLLSTKLFGAVFGVLLGALTLVPGLGLFVLFGINGHATRVLKQNGYRVGLLGADLSKFR